MHRSREVGRNRMENHLSRPGDFGRYTFMELPEHLVSCLATWNDNRGISPSDWICCVGNYDHFIGFSRLIWPEFIDFSGRIYIADFFSQNDLDSRLEQGTLPEIAQRFINVLDLSGLFSQADETPSDSQLLYLTEILRQTWSAKLALDYPNRSIHIFIENNLDEPGVGEILISFSEA